MLYLMRIGLESRVVTVEDYLKKLYNSLEEIFVNHNYAIFIEDENNLRKSFSVIEEIHEKVFLKYYALTLMKINISLDENEFIILQCVKSLYHAVDFSYFFSFKNFGEKTNFIYSTTHFNLGELNKEARKHIKGDVNKIKKILRANDILEFKEIPNGIKFGVPISVSVMRIFV